MKLNRSITKIYYCPQANPQIGAIFLLRELMGVTFLVIVILIMVCCCGIKFGLFSGIISRLRNTVLRRRYADLLNYSEEESDLWILAGINLYVIIGHKAFVTYYIKNLRF